MALPPMTTGTRSLAWIRGRVKDGKPSGNGPSTSTPAVPPSPSMPTATVAAMTAKRMPGTRGQRFDRRINASALAPIAKAVQFALPFRTDSAIPSKSCSGPVLSMETWKRLGI